MIDQVLKQLSLDKNTPIVVAVSGGPDSMALLSLLEPFFETIICAHVNHNTGRIGQDEEEQFVKFYCQKKNHIFESMTIGHYEPENFHHQAHKMRYHFFEKILKKYHSHYLFTAHHGDDLMETMLFRLIRGSTIKAFHGFSMIFAKEEYTIIRPLLPYTKKQLLEYNVKHKIEYCIDSSNEKELYTRNRIRKHVLPFIKSENKTAHLKFLNVSEEIEKMEVFIQKYVNLELQKRFVNDTLDVTQWNQIDEIIQIRVLQAILSYFYSDQGVLTSHHIQILQALILKSNSGSIVQFPKKLKIQKEYDRLRFFYNETKEAYESELKTDLQLENGHRIQFVSEEQDDSNFICRLSQKELVFPLIVRTRKPQDRMLVKGLNGFKKIKEIFINEKVPIHLRQTWPIVTDKNGKIVWIPGLKKSQFDKTKEEKYDIILKYY